MIDTPEVTSCHARVALGFITRGFQRQLARTMYCNVGTDTGDPNKKHNRVNVTKHVDGYES